MTILDINESDGPMSELFGAQIPRIDLVGLAANGTGFLFAKSAEDPSMLDADTVRALIKESKGENAVKILDVIPGVNIEKADDDVTTPLSDEADLSAPGASDPGSPAWEAIDHATADKWVGILYRAINALNELAARENTEAVVGDQEDGSMNAYMLSDAASAVEYAVDTLAVYSAGELAEAQIDTELAGVGKSLEGAIGSLEVLERFAPLVKAGRVLSASNETALRDAVDAIQKVLAALPPAPEAEPVEKETTAMTALSTLSPEELAAAIVKGDNLQAVFDQSGNLLGVIKPTALMPVDGGQAPDDDSADDSAADDAADAAGTDPEAPADANDVGTPTNAPASTAPVEKGTEDTTDQVAELRKELTTKDEEHVLVVKGLEAQIEVLKAEPATSKVIVNGQIPAPHLMRGQNAGAEAISASASVVKDLHQKAEAASTPAEQEAAKNTLQGLAAAKLREIRGQ